MGRGKETGLVSGLAVNALEHGADRSFAVGAGYVDDAQSILRITRLFSETAWVFKAKLGSEKAEVIKPLDGLGVGHG